MDLNRLIEVFTSSGFKYEKDESNLNKNRTDNEKSFFSTWDFIIHKLSYSNELTINLMEDFNDSVKPKYYVFFSGETSHSNPSTDINNSMDFILKRIEYKIGENESKMVIRNLKLNELSI